MITLQQLLGQLAPRSGVGGPPGRGNYETFVNEDPFTAPYYNAVGGFGDMMQGAMGQIGQVNAANQQVAAMQDQLMAQLMQQQQQQDFLRKMFGSQSEVSSNENLNKYGYTRGLMGLEGDIQSRLQRERFGGLGDLLGGPMTRLLGSLGGMFGGGGAGGPISGFTAKGPGGEPLGSVSLPTGGGPAQQPGQPPATGGTHPLSNQWAFDNLARYRQMQEKRNAPRMLWEQGIGWKQTGSPFAY